VAGGRIPILGLHICAQPSQIVLNRRVLGTLVQNIRSTGAVIFDLDGTLVDSEPLSKVAWRRVLALHGYSVNDADITAAQGLRFAESYAKFARASPLPALDIMCCTRATTMDL
jgi:hypothetical protein